MKDYFTNCYVPKRLMDEWEDESGNVFWYNPFEKKYKEGKKRDFFRDKITGLEEDEIGYMKTLDEKINSSFFFDVWGERNDIQREESLFRSSVLFSYMRTPPINCTRRVLTARWLI